jgi:hypothetical protein
MSVLDHSAVRQRTRPRRPLLLGLRVALRRRRLDRLLAEGRDSAADPRLALRAEQLARIELRARLARSLREATRCCHESMLARMLTPQAPVAAASVRECAGELRDLARALTDVDPRIRGVAIVHGMVTDGLGPLYVPGRADELRALVRCARAGL